MVAEADVVYVGNAEIANRLRPLRADVVEAWCPGILFDAKPFEPAELSVFTFGMAHKVRGEYYRKLDQLLQQTGKSYCLYLSTALHEGISIETAFDAALKNIRDGFSGPVYFLGFLSDAAVLHYLRTTTYFAAFFPTGVRANNTSSPFRHDGGRGGDHQSRRRLAGGLPALADHDRHRCLRRAADRYPGAERDRREGRSSSLSLWLARARRSPA